MSLRPDSQASGGPRVTHQAGGRLGLAVVVGDQPLPVHDLEGDLVDVDRMGVRGEVVELPDLGVPTLGFSVTGSPRPRDAACRRHRRYPAGPPPGRPRTADIISISASRRVVLLPGAVRWRGAAGTAAGSWDRGPAAGTTRNCMTWPVESGSADVEVPLRLPAAEGLVRSDVAQDVPPDRDCGEVDDEIGPLRQPHEQPVAVIDGQVDRRREEAALVADLPDLDPRDAGEVQDQEPRLAAVEHAEAVAPLVGPWRTARCCR